MLVPPDPLCAAPNSLSTLIYTLLSSNPAISLDPGETGKAFCYQLAMAIYTYIGTADVVVNTAGLQTSTTVGSPTGAPAIPVTLKIT